MNMMNDMFLKYNGKVYYMYCPMYRMYIMNDIILVININDKEYV